MFDLSAIQILIVLVIALVVFGPKRLPELGRQIGRGLREIKSQVSAISDDVRSDSEPQSSPDPAPSRTDAEEVAAESDADLLEGVVVSGSTGPEKPRALDP